MPECKNGLSKADMLQLLERAFMEITQKVAGFQVNPTVTMKVDVANCQSLLLRTSGDYTATLVLKAEDHIFYEIACSMKRNREITQDDLAVYTTEYFNMLCGYLVSHLNHRTGMKARFGIARLVKEEGVSGLFEGEAVQLFYECPYGQMVFQSIDLPILA